MLNTQARIVANDVSDQGRQLFLVTDQDQLEVLIFAQSRGGRAHNNLGAEVAAHGIQRYG